MKKAVCLIFCFAVVSCIFSVTAFSNDFDNRAISAFQKFRELNQGWTTAFMSGDSAAQKEKGKLLSDHKDGEFAYILKALPAEYCASPSTDVLKEFIKTVISTSNGGDEYPTYVFAELFACDPDRVAKEIMSLTPEEQPVILENLDYGFKNIAYKVESLPNYKALVEKLENLKGANH